MEQKGVHDIVSQGNSIPISTDVRQFSGSDEISRVLDNGFINCVKYNELLNIPTNSDANEKLLPLHSLLIVVAGDEVTRSTLGQNRSYMSPSGRDGSIVSHQSGTSVGPTAVRFYSLQSNCYVKVLRFRSTVFMVKCSPLIVAMGLEKEIHCIDAVKFENKFTVPTYPVP
ncbi:hypothetical protein L1887_06206 [Cichorium endivia]|nr:hypothetical protein L1887_06206 [Cichorium endivia]